MRNFVPLDNAYLRAAGKYMSDMADIHFLVVVKTLLSQEKVPVGFTPCLLMDFLIDLVRTEGVG